MMNAQNKEHKEYYSNGNIKILGFVDSSGKPIREWKWYYEFENERLFATMFFKDGNLEGEVKKYVQGKVSAVESYKAGIPSGEWKSYFSNGSLEKIEHYENEQSNGEVKIFAENGELIVFGNYKNGKSEGEFKAIGKYNNEGELVETIHYKNGEKTE